MSHKKYRTETNCLNCGVVVAGKFCSECGQENLETRENFFHLAGHFISDYFHFDSKFFRSLIPLFTKPGFLTKEYWEGKRVHYIHPLRLYFFITIVFMFAATYFYHLLDKRVKDSLVTTTVELGHADSLKLKNDPIAIQKEIESIKATEKEKAMGGLDNYFHDLKYISFFLLPIYAFVFKLLFLRKKAFYVDHLVYTLHLQSFVYLLVSFVFLVATLLPEALRPIRLITLITILIYIAFSLRFLYHEKWWKTILKSLTATFLLAMVMGMTLGVYLIVAYIMHK